MIIVTSNRNLIEFKLIVLAPNDLKFFDILLPIPLEAPVIKTILFFKTKIVKFFIFNHKYDKHERSASCQIIAG